MNIYQGYKIQFLMVGLVVYSWDAEYCMMLLLYHFIIPLKYPNSQPKQEDKY